MQSIFNSGPVAVTGALGLLGANLVANIAGRGFRTSAIDREGFPDWPRVESVSCDLSDVRRSTELLEKLQPSCIVHCAALTNVDWCESHPEGTWDINVEMSRHLAATAGRIGASFVYISSDSVFDGTSGGYTETDPTGPVNVYARSKLAGEIAVRDALGESLVLRTNIYGWNMQSKFSLAEWILNQMESRSRFPGFQDVVFCPLLVNDLGDCILEMLERRLTGLYHLTASDACSKYEFAVRLAEVFGLDASLVQPSTVGDCVLQAARPKNTSLNTGRTARALGRPTPTVAAGLQRFKALRETGYVAHLKGALQGAQNA
jgi:dTDP-4-dehydrorhamnose reductase